MGRMVENIVEKNQMNHYAIIMLNQQSNLGGKILWCEDVLLLVRLVTYGRRLVEKGEIQILVKIYIIGQLG